MIKLGGNIFIPLINLLHALLAERTHVENLMIEKQCVGLSNQARLIIRQKESAVIIDKMRDWLDKSLLQSPKQSKLGNPQ